MATEEVNSVCWGCPRRPGAEHVGDNFLKWDFCKEMKSI